MRSRVSATGNADFEHADDRDEARGGSGDDEPMDECAGDAFGRGGGDASKNEAGLRETKQPEHATRFLFRETTQAGHERGDESGHAKEFENVPFGKGERGGFAAGDEERTEVAVEEQGERQ